MADTIFTKIVQGEVPCHKVYENDKILAFLDIYPNQKGHCLIIPKENYENILDLPEDVASEILVVGKKVVEAMEIVLKPDGYNFFQSNGKFAGQEIMHYHMHIVPRYKDLGKPGVKNMFDKYETTDSELAKLAEKLREKLK